eukprot:CAMPEP_0194202348 /NCGR_PEP_ID=MMETSP0156-20130528/2396_1 /TAXON_ID=33649 /ORGANISM="Thalassionema nitzschioides, Strain L26-B" /LENGTH=198 /DNA_ID=CAMNT_0038927815 /DNA_START=56 /DNA_END=652 /DNA_ORIENTATION=+
MSFADLRPCISGRGIPLWKIIFGISFLLNACFIEANDEDKSPIVSTEFLNACTFGDVKQVEEALEENRSWAHGRSSQGETCLHVAGIQGQAAITKLVLEKGGDPNVRTTFPQGLRMHPLSWNAYAGHVETAKVLLENGASVNLDFDSMGQPQAKVTVLDIVTQILDTDSNADVEKFVGMKELLLKHGAKLYSELEQEL